MSDIDSLLASIESLDKQVKLHELKGKALMKKHDALVEELQETCPHHDTQQESTYCGGGYDYCAETFYKLTCNTCSKVLKTWSKVHHGIYG